VVQPIGPESITTTLNGENSLKFKPLSPSRPGQAIQWRLCKSSGCNSSKMQSEDKFVTNYQSIDQRNKQTKPKRSQTFGWRDRKGGLGCLVKRFGYVFGIGIEIALQLKQKQFKYNGTTTTRSPEEGNVNNSAQSTETAATAN